MKHAYRNTVGILAIGLIGLAAFVGISALVKSAVSRRYCRPVVPEIAVSFAGETLSVLDGEMLIIYYEDASIPFDVDDGPQGPRFGGCTPRGESCFHERARYEIPREGPRYQAVQLRGLTGLAIEGRETTGNPIIGNLRWRGASYPHRVEIECNVKNLDPGTACSITRTITDYDAYVAEFGEARSTRSRHDQCSPNPFEIL